VHRHVDRAPARGELTSTCPADGEPIAKVLQASEADYEAVVAASEQAFRTWRIVPAPRRGEIVRQMGEELRRMKKPLAS